MKIIFTFLLSFVLIFSAENEEINRLKLSLKSSDQDSNKVLIFRDLAFEFASSNPIVATYYADSCINLSKKIKSIKGEAAAYNAYGIINFSQSSYPKALEYYFRALKLNESINYSKGIASNYGNIGNAYYQQNNYEMSLSYHNKALDINEKINNQNGISNNLSNIGLVYFSKQLYIEALKYYQRSLKINKSMNNQSGIASNLNNIGLVYSNSKDYKKSIDNYNLTLLIFEKLGDKSNIANTLSNIGNIYLKLNNINKSEEFLTRSIKLSREIGAKNILKTTLYDMHILNEIKGNHKEALINLREHFAIRDSIYNIESNLKMTQLDFRYKEDKKDKEIQLLKLSDDNQKVELKNKSLTIYFSIAGIILISLLTFFIFTRFQIKKKSNVELENKNNQIEKQNIEVNEKNEEILSSIRYAEKIQNAILPFESTIKASINNFFILFKPKDIISGDFYWFNETKDKIYLAAVDCTGHGVPGSMLSMIGAMILNEAIQLGNYKVNEIMDYLNNTFNFALSNSNLDLETSELRDGMDICLISINKSDNQVDFCGANRPLYYVSNNELNEKKGTRKSIGGKSRNTNEFESHTISITNKTFFYLTTDGYADQSNEFGKKLSTKKLKQILLSINNLDLSSQKEALINQFKEHKLNTEQRDDVTIVGFEL